MSMHRNRIAAPGLRDNDWAHAPYDDMRFAAAGRGNREPAPVLDGIVAEDDEETGMRSTPADHKARQTRQHGPGTGVIAADMLEGEEVRNGAGERLGEIIDLMIDVPTGRVAYAVMSVGGTFGSAEKLFAIPWKSLRLDPGKRSFRLDVAKAHFNRAPGFEQEHWPSMADERWARDIHAYYNVAPYWE